MFGSCPRRNSRSTATGSRSASGAALPSRLTAPGACCARLRHVPQRLALRAAATGALCALALRAAATGSLSALALALALAFTTGCAERRPNAEASPAHVGNAPPPPAAPAASTPASPSPSLGAASGSAASPPDPRTPASSAAAPNALASSARAPNAAASASPPPLASAASSESAPSLLDAEGKPLPQTEDRPRVDSPAFKQRIEQLAQAIIRDDPNLARSTFFPVVAYEQVKAIAKPARDWQYRLIRGFETDIHEYHRALGPNPEQAKLAGIDVPEPSARWMKPGSEGNRLGYYRVLRSRLRFTKADGKERTLELTSMISWRGEWYVVHLNGFD